MGPEMAPKPPNVRSGAAQPGRFSVRAHFSWTWGARHGPQTPKRSKRRGTAVPLLCQRALRWGPEMARSVNVGGLDVPPTPPNARGTPGNPGRPAIPVAVLDEASVMLAA